MIARAGVERRVELLRVVHLDQRLEPGVAARSASSRVSSASLERADDQQHGVGARGPRFEDW